MDNGSRRNQPGHKIVIIGGGGFRTPRLLYGIGRAAERLGVSEVTLYDTDLGRLDTMHALGRHLLGRLGSPIPVTAQPNFERAIAGAAFIFLTYRPGGERARAADERAALDVGVLGQETVGPGGLFMALRSIPVTLDYLRRIRAVVPRAYVINFCNPVGVLSEAVAATGDNRFVGVCDTPYHLQMELGAYLGLPPDALRVESVGLNHLGWFLRVYAGGKDQLPTLLTDLDRLRTSVRPLSFFSTDEIQAMDALPTEYVYLYQHANLAVARLRAAGTTRGENIVQWSTRFYAEAQSLVARGQVPAAWSLYTETILRRSNSYLAAETGSDVERGLTEESIFASGGYEGVALRAMEGLMGRGPVTAILNVPSRGVVNGLAPDEIFEGTCFVDEHGVLPLPLTREIPDPVRALIMGVKRFEVAAVAAAASGKPSDAVEALAVHPLVQDVQQARDLVQRRQSLPESPWDGEGEPTRP